MSSLSFGGSGACIASAHGVPSKKTVRRLLNVIDYIAVPRLVPVSRFNVNDCRGELRFCSTAPLLPAL